MNIAILEDKMKLLFIKPKVEVALNVDTFVYLLKLNNTVYTIEHVSTTYDSLKRYLLKNENITLYLKDKVITYIFPEIGV